MKEDDTVATVILNSPNNPTGTFCFPPSQCYAQHFVGAAYPDSLVKELSDVIKLYPHVSVIFDEVYRTIIYDAQYVNILLSSSSPSFL